MQPSLNYGQRLRFPYSIAPLNCNSRAELDLCQETQKGISALTTLHERSPKMDALNKTVQFNVEAEFS